MTAALILFVGLALLAGLVAVMVRVDRAHRRLVERRREAWKAEGEIGAGPDDFLGRGFNVGH